MYCTPHHVGDDDSASINTDELNEPLPPSTVPIGLYKKTMEELGSSKPKKEKVKTEKKKAKAAEPPAKNALEASTEAVAKAIEKSTSNKAAEMANESVRVEAERMNAQVSACLKLTS